MVERHVDRAFNRFRAYTDFAICPLPPVGDDLDIAIEAGEQIPFERRGERQEEKAR